MNQRDNHLLRMRPEDSFSPKNDIRTDENFQNFTLRPIIELQNDLLVEVFKNYLIKHKTDFLVLPVDKKLNYIDNAVQKDIKFRNSLKGMILGQFTLQEYDFYITKSSALNKRMMSLVIERLKRNIQLFDEAKPVE